MELTPHQQEAFDLYSSWREKSREMSFSLAGLAGTGKTTVLAELVKKHPDTVVLAPTGKAATVLRRKGIPADTVHSAIYHFEHEDKEGKPVFSRKETLGEEGSRITLGHVMVDEASMIQTSMHEDLCRVSDTILYSGDPGQLEPVGEDARVLETPSFELKEIHRQALDSGIIRFAHNLRRGDAPIVAATDCGPEVEVWGSRKVVEEMIEVADTFICPHNHKRIAINRAVRAHFGFAKPEPQPGEKVICLFNNRRKWIFNGEVFVVESVIKEHKNTWEMEIVREDEAMDDTAKPILVHALKEQFDQEKKLTRDQLPEMDIFELARGFDYFDWGYCLTGHKAQGSEWDTVCVLDTLGGGAKLFNPQRWRYTAATRAAKKLHYIVS